MLVCIVKTTVEVKMLGCGCQGRDILQGESQDQIHQDRTIYF